MCDEVLIFFLFEWHLICSTHYATTSLISQQFSSIKLPTLQSMDKDTIYQSCMFHFQVGAKNRILSNRNKLIYIFYNAAITNFKLVMLPSDSPPEKTWVKIPYLSSLAVPLPSYAEKYDF